MPKLKKKGYNWKARQVVNTIVDDSSTKKIHVELDDGGRYDESNPLALPSEKRKTRIKKDKTQVTRLLPKKKRKLLEKVVEKKKKKENRASLFEALAKVQATPEELEKLTSITDIQTKGLKRYFTEEQNAIEGKVKKEARPVEIDILKGWKRKPMPRKEIVYDKNDPNIVGFESSGSSESESEDETEAKRTKLDVEVKEEATDGETIEAIEQEVVTVESQPQKVETDKSNGRTDAKQPEIIERKPAVFVEVNRSPEIQAARLKLPILREEQEIMELINENNIVIIAGETGSGKTTQIPQFLYEAGYALKKQIGVTEPRRVAAISMSERVAKEMNLTSREVSYLIRFEGNVTEDTKIKFMTDGVLLKEIQRDPYLKKYAVLILDEAHERSVYTDILIGLLSRIVPLRNKKGDPLKLVVMSATLRLEDFTQNQRLFKVPPPVFKVETRQYPVTVHFQKRTDENYLKAAFNKAAKIHKTEAEGGILIFVTGQQEVNSLVWKLRRAFPLRHKKRHSEATEDEAVEEGLRLALKRKRKTKVIPEINLDDYSVADDNEELLTDDELSGESDWETGPISTGQPLWTVPLYSLLPSQRQAEVFRPPPPGCRLCIVSTNVAETSLTIPNVRYVVDTGKTKVKLYDKVTGVSSYVVTWTSKASADQRAGRAGRLGPGKCFRLYSSAVFNDEFPRFSVPEIQRKPVDDLYLQLKCMSVGDVENFPFPTAPDILQLKMAGERLRILGALDDKGKATPLGREIVKLPVLPRFGKMLALSNQFDLLPYTICLVAALSVQEVLLETPIAPANPKETEDIRQKWSAIRRQWARAGNSLLLGDNMVLLCAVGGAEYANSQGKLEQFCEENGLRPKAIAEIRKLRVQLTNEMRTNFADIDVAVDPKLMPPSDEQARWLRQLLLIAMGDQVAKKVAPDEVKGKKSAFKFAYRANNMEEPVFLHRSSVLRGTLPELVVYQEIYETGNRMYMRGVTAIEPEWLVTYVPTLCRLSEPSLKSETTYNPSTGKIYCRLSGTFGPQAWPIEDALVEYPRTTPLAYKWFARFLLEGAVFEKLKKYVKSLQNTPATMVKDWGKLRPWTVSLLKALAARDVCSREDLERVWEKEPKYLLPEYLQWLKAEKAEVSLIWPPVD